MGAEISQEAAESIFSDLEPSMSGIAAKLGVPDPAGEARSWYARFSDIIHSFNTGRLRREIHREDGSVEEVSDTPSAEQREEFVRSLKSYLKTAFKHDLIQAFNKRKRFVQVDDPDYAMSSRESPVKTHIIASEEEVIRLSDLITLIEADCKRKKRSVSVARDQVNYLFLLATLRFHKAMMKEYGDMPIVRDLMAKDSRDFFIFDIRDGRTEAIGDILAKLISQEPTRAAVLCSKKLLSPDKGYFTLNRKISRYFNNAMGGMPARLKRLKAGNVTITEDVDV